ncbi:MAG: CoA-binding protein [Firmicutes bacterium]|nr:CoA-binding protein [Bacillota bacterium]
MDSLIQKILRTARVLAVVGLSEDPRKPSHRVARYLQTQGYRIIPVNPALTALMGERAFPDLAALPAPADVALIFRKPEQVLPVVEQAVTAGVKTIWMQEGIVNETAAALAREHGLDVVMDRCMLKEHQRLARGEKSAQGLPGAGRRFRR